MTSVNYSTIKSFARRDGLKVADLLALSAGSDPFYVGAPGQIAKAHWGAKIYEGMGSPSECHVRRVHYWIVSQDPKIIKPNGDEYLNTVRDWEYLNLALKYARYAELIPARNFVDRRNPPPIVNAYAWPNELPSDTVTNIDVDKLLNMLRSQITCFNPHNTQAYLMEIFCEKSTMNDVLEPLCRKFGVNLVTGLGELSITAVRNLVEERIVGSEKPTIIFYISDFDPAGECMPISVARKIEYFIRTSEIEHRVKLRPIMLTEEQCAEYNLPRTPIKESEGRKSSFEKRHGQGATELDALESLHPGELERLVTREILKYFCVDSWNEALLENDVLRDHVYEHLTQSSGIAKKLINALHEIDLDEFDSYEPMRGNLVDDFDDDNNWLYDSERDYMTQITAYKQHKGGDTI